MAENNFEVVRGREVRELYDSILSSIKGAVNPKEEHISVAAIAFLAMVAKTIEYERLSEYVEEKVGNETARVFLMDAISKHQNTIISVKGKAEKRQLEAILLYSDELSNEFGESTTPIYISDLALKMMEVSSNDIILDLGSGLGGFLVEAAEKTKCKKMYGVEINTSNVILSSIKSLVLDKDVSIIQGNIISQEFNHLQATKVFSNFPFGLRIQSVEQQIANHPQLKKLFKNAKRTITSDWLFVMAAYEAMAESGKAVCVMANNGTWNQSDQEIRQMAIEKGIVEGVIALPSNLFSHTSIAVTMIVLSKDNKTIKMVDASNVFTDKRRQNILSEENIEEILSMYDKESSISKVVGLEEIRNNEYTLNPVRYFDYADDIKDGIALGDLVHSINRGAMIKSNELDELVVAEKTGYHYLMLQNISDGVIDRSLPNLKEIEEKLQKYCIANNSLIVSKISPFKVALAQFDDEEKVLANGNLYFINVDESKVNPVFLEAFLQSEAGLAQLTRLSKGTYMSSISIQDLRKVKIPKVSFEEQNRIADEYNSLKDQLIVLGKQVDIIKDKKSRLLEGVI